MIVGRGQRRSVFWSVAILWSSGVFFWWLDLVQRGPQAWRPRLLAIHGFAAIGFTALAGSLWPHHVVRAWRAGANRASGASLVAWSAVMAASGWGLYYFGSETLREVTRNLHLWLGVAAPLAIVIHVVRGRIWRRRLLAERDQGRRSADQP